MQPDAEMTSPWEDLTLGIGSDQDLGASRGALRFFQLRTIFHGQLSVDSAPSRLSDLVGDKSETEVHSHGTRWRSESEENLSNLRDFPSP